MMVVRHLEEKDFPALLTLLESQDSNPQTRTMSPEARSVEELQLELGELSPYSELFPFVLASPEDDSFRAYVCLCNYDGEAFLEGPLLVPGLEPSTATPLVEKAVQAAEARGYGFIDAFVDEENKRAQTLLERAGFDPFHTTYIYELQRDHASKPSPKTRKDLRIVTGDDIEASSYRDLYRETSDKWASRLAWSDEELLERFADDKVKLLLAYLKDELIGHLELEYLTEDDLNTSIAEIAYFGVLPAARGKGIGRELLARGITTALEHKDVELILARAHDDERAACKSLETLGFRLSHGVIAYTLELD